MNSYLIGFRDKVKFLLLNTDKTSLICKDSDIMSSGIILIKKLSQEYLRFIQPHNDKLKTDVDEILTTSNRKSLYMSTDSPVSRLLSRNHNGARSQFSDTKSHFFFVFLLDLQRFSHCY